MVAEVQNQLPQLSPEDRSLLLLYIQFSENLFALAAHLAANHTTSTTASSPNSLSPQLPPLDILHLLSWTTLPHIAAYISAHRDHTNHLLKSQCLAALNDIVLDSDDPTEKRRAATTILRALNPATRRRDRAGEAPRPRRATSKPPREAEEGLPVTSEAEDADDLNDDIDDDADLDEDADFEDGDDPPPTPFPGGAARSSNRAVDTPANLQTVSPLPVSDSTSSRLLSTPPGFNTPPYTAAARSGLRWGPEIGQEFKMFTKSRGPPSCAWAA